MDSRKSSNAANRDAVAGQMPKLPVCKTPATAEESPRSSEADTGDGVAKVTGSRGPDFSDAKEQVETKAKHTSDKEDVERSKPSVGSPGKASSPTTTEPKAPDNLQDQRNRSQAVEKVVTDLAKHRLTDTTAAPAFAKQVRNPCEPDDSDSDEDDEESEYDGDDDFGGERVYHGEFAA